MNSDTSLTCIASLPVNLSLPVIFVYYWFHSSFDYFRIYNSTLNISNVNVSSAGQYECFAFASVNSSYVYESAQYAFGYLTVTGMLILYQ